MDEKALREKGLVRRHDPIKITSDGKLTKKLTIKVDRLTKPAIAAVEKAGGKAEQLNPEPKWKTKPETKPAAPPSKPEGKKEEKKAKTEGPKSEAPKAEGPKAEKPKTEGPKTDESKP